MDIRSNPEQIDPAWMTAALQVRCPGCVVTGLQGESIGTGQVGENVRFSLTGTGVPASVVGKFRLWIRLASKPESCSAIMFGKCFFTKACSRL